ncbi:PHP domain-containing protein [Myxacorys almedinensis]|uniref:PHP domain-containing protein n=1 Tax=Myxacorys almedinensis A TaxID=2690445 RepID=A0A8J7Z364_9CYAN|nr:PHP domain-containing protein [Myxacorys almedinensis]NDJ17273.1 PHP domain-containing protein [Myxacorys almedinensis A]
MAANLAPVPTFEKPAAQDVASLRQVFASLTAESCPHFYNFHMHTHCSDGQLHPESLARQTTELSLKGFAITDHHQIAGFYEAQRWLEEWQQSTDQTMPHLWTGVEITSRLLDTEVHILGFAFDPQHRAIASYLKGAAPLEGAAIASNVISAIHQAGGLAILAHPARYRRLPDDLIPAAVNSGIDGVEAYYSYNNPKPWRPSPEATRHVHQLGAKYHLLNTCGTDTHGLSLLQRL